jgi:hypothetical protein
MHGAGFFCLFGRIVLLALYLQDLMGYTEFQAGLILGPGGIAAFFRNLQSRFYSGNNQKLCSVKAYVENIWIS